MKIPQSLSLVVLCITLQACFQNSSNSNRVQTQTENIKVEEVCDYCNGSGYVYSTCSYCDGTGRTVTYSAKTTRKSCSACYGSGKMRCNRCNGYGYTSCSGCSGNGYRSCNVCKGNGRVYIMGEYMTCPTCNGRLRIECSLCNGSGRHSCSCDNGMTYCSTCMGSGKSNEMQTETKSGYENCSNCYGSGRVRTICPKCDGEGEVIVIKTVEKHVRY